ncbi:MAG: hypothetical protein HQK91_02050 [Nitrospirae bacterium]|nr:hypothetical protein [Nitrospirota bacterium]MBF0540218.1 hypothetical protein [Nitrospirota bacterium]
MKKLTIILIVILSMTIMLSGVAFALQNVTLTSKTVGAGQHSTTFTPSTNVTIFYASQATGLTYAAGANHNKGSKTYGSTSTNASIYQLANTSTPSSLVAPSSSADASAPVGFTNTL